MGTIVKRVAATAVVQNWRARHRILREAPRGDSVLQVFSRSARPSELLALGLAFVFLYAAMSAMVDPATYRSYLPEFLNEGPPWIPDFLLRLFGLFEVAVALGVLVPRYRLSASLVSAMTLVGIVVLNLDAFEILFRNVAIALAALALAGLTHQGEEVRSRAPVTPTAPTDQRLAA